MPPYDLYAAVNVWPIHTAQIGLLPFICTGYGGGRLTQSGEFESLLGPP